MINHFPTVYPVWYKPVLKLSFSFLFLSSGVIVLTVKRPQYQSFIYTSETRFIFASTGEFHAEIKFLLLKTYGIMTHISDYWLAAKFILYKWVIITMRASKCEVHVENLKYSQDIDWGIMKDTYQRIMKTILRTVFPQLLFTSNGVTTQLTEVLLVQSVSVKWLVIANRLCNYSQTLIKKKSLICKKPNFLTIYTKRLHHDPFFTISYLLSLFFLAGKNKTWYFCLEVPGGSMCLKEQ